MWHATPSSSSSDRECSLGNGLELVRCELELPLDSIRWYEEEQKRDPATGNELASNLIPADNEPSKWPIKVESGQEPKNEWPKADVPLSVALEESGS